MTEQESRLDSRSDNHCVHHFPRSSWTGKLLDNLLPYSDYDTVQEEAVEKLENAHNQSLKKETTDEQKNVSSSVKSQAFSSRSHSPKAQLGGRKEFSQTLQDAPRRGPRVSVCQMGVASHGPLASIKNSESNTPSKSGSMTSMNDLSSSMNTRVSTMRRSMEAEMMDRLLQLCDDDTMNQGCSGVQARTIQPSSDRQRSSGNNKYSTKTRGGSSTLSSASDQNPAGSGKSTTSIIPDKTYWREKKFIQRYIKELNTEREQMKEAWRAEWEKEEEDNRRCENFNGSSICESANQMSRGCFSSLLEGLSHAEVFISNMPLTIGAVGLSWVTQGTVWFKFTEEFVDSCIPTHYFDPKCVYHEFPSCFVCDTTNSTYKTALAFHLICHTIAAVCCLLFLGKCVLAWRVVADELSNPTTATPIGVVCITVICVLAGRFGFVGKLGVVSVSIFHVLLSFWFLWIAVFRFRLWPDPSWFPCTVGIAYASIKSWLYYPTFGWCIMILCILYFVGTFFLAIYRAYTNMKISAPVCFISLSAPSIAMYAMTIMAQPSSEREALLEASPELTTRWDEIHRHAYIPLMHVMMILSILGFASSLHSLAARWEEFKIKPFSPAHAAFVFPVLSHTNALQAYRRVVIGFALGPSPYHSIITFYWISCLIGGTVLNFIFSSKYASRLPKWTNFDKLIEYVDGDESLFVPPPEPNETIVHELWADTNAHEAMRENFSNPAVLQANEAGILVRRRRGTDDFYRKGPYARSRNIPSIGFDPILTQEELRRERAELLDWVAKNNPRQRNKTMSIPSGYGTFGGILGDQALSKAEADMLTSHRRARTDLV